MLVNRYYTPAAFGDVTPETGEIRHVAAPANPHCLGCLEYDIHDRPVCLVRGGEDSLSLVVRHPYLRAIRIDRRVSSSIERSYSFSTIHITIKGEPVLDLAFPNLPTFENDPTPLIEPEDFDFALFLHSLINDQEMRQRAYRSTPPLD